MKTAESMSVELQRKINGVLARQGDRLEGLIVIIHPDVMERMKSSDSDLFVDLERKHNSRLTFRSDPTYHREQIVFIDPKTKKEISS